ncbi:MAG: LD-carboxypeptidase [Sphingobacteriales bacterium]|jgi:muramoyltetrapeptide carboxypeptidase|nr:LD-carboxypeptidase [Sphingobacteriales bacterium]MBP9140995.1 LD-carboxypeptidase [Chitinophagales bacterium]MDA0198622.1 LD-carboxypeptidase [Bacteroidota bacterium]MBK6890261.1 LD-carboxypeptidase [Sphingobacteriales bacterium]MBK7527212.1 LD-carboxypeptidase [Sphingobacteriales bacterium]
MSSLSSSSSSSLLPIIRAGDTVVLVAPAYSVSESTLQIAVKTYESWGLKVQYNDQILAQSTIYAGTDAHRAQVLQAALNHKQAKAIIFLRGGYGTVRVIDLLRFNQFKRFPKWVVGFSDTTVLFARLLRMGFACIHATMPIMFENATPQALETLRQALFSGENLNYQTSAHHLNRYGQANGRLIGGNLSILYSLLTTRDQLKTKNAILFIEDVGEYMYHIDRMLITLKRGGHLANLSGLVVGSFTQMNDTATPFNKTCYEIIAEHVAAYSYPALYGLPAGHQPDNRALYLGLPGQLVVSENGANWQQNIVGI